MKKFLIITGVLALVIAGGLFYWEQYSLLSLFEFDLVGVNVLNLSLTKMNLKLKLKLTSKSKIEFTVSKINVQIYVNGSHVSDAYQEAAQSVPAMGYNFVYIDTIIQNNNFINQAMGIAGGDPNAPIKVRTVGTCDITSSDISLSAPFDQTYTTTLNELLKGNV